MDRTGTTAVLKRSDKLAVLATNNLNDPMDTSPVAVDRQWFLRAEKCLHCVEEVR